MHADKIFAPDFENEDKQVMRWNTTLKNKMYEFIYSAEPNEFSQYISTAEEIINSSEIIDAYDVAKVDVNNPLKSNFTSYHSPTYGFNITYPMDWEANDYGKSLVEFTPKNLMKVASLRHCQSLYQ